MKIWYLNLFVKLINFINTLKKNKVGVKRPTVPDYPLDYCQYVKTVESDTIFKLIEEEGVYFIQHTATGRLLKIDEFWLSQLFTNGYR